MDASATYSTAGTPTLRACRPSNGGHDALTAAFRQLRQHPGFALITVLVLGLGTGAATAVFTVIDAVVLRRSRTRRPIAW